MTENKPMHTLNLDLGTHGCPIYIGENLLQNSSLLQKHVTGHQVMIVSNENVAQFYLGDVKKAFSHCQCDVVLLPDGEEYKSLTTVSTLFDQLIANRHHRTTTLLALGGGIIGDMTGFAAACYQRGVNFIQIPTTLLAQVDASIGGKTGVNHPLGKNMIGAFHQPRCVIIDIKTLASLPERQLSAGLAEVIKAALIQSPEFFEWLEKNLEKILSCDSGALIYAISHACAIKTHIVAQDEKEAGLRALLNLGHTFAHAIEQNLNYQRWLHGEAVAVGLVMAAEVSKRLHWLNHHDVSRILHILTRAKLPTQLPNGLQCTPLLDAMAVDKKVKEQGKLRFVLLKTLGQAVLSSDVSTDIITDVLLQYGAEN